MSDCAADASLVTDDDGNWVSTCGCGHVCCPSGTYDEAAAALEAHRNPEE